MTSSPDHISICWSCVACSQFLQSAGWHGMWGLSQLNYKDLSCKPANLFSRSYHSSTKRQTTHGPSAREISTASNQAVKVTSRPRHRILTLATTNPIYFNKVTHGIPMNDQDCIGTILAFSANLIRIVLPLQGPRYLPHPARNKWLQPSLATNRAIHGYTNASLLTSQKCKSMDGEYHRCRNKSQWEE